jgi:hypothetical protein
MIVALDADAHEGTLLASKEGKVVPTNAAL